MKTSDFKTMNKTLPMAFPCSRKYWLTGLDLGYSGVKGISPNKAFCFPAYARQIPNRVSILKESSPTDIRYKDDVNGEWVVGSLAYDEVNASEVIDSESELYGRNRFYSPMFLVQARTGIAMGMMENKTGIQVHDRKLVVQTGLPPKFEKKDTPDLKAALSGHHSFDLKVGRLPWKHFEYTLDENDIYVMPQPMGALVSASINKEGRPVPDAAKFFNSNVIIFDPGFGTVDSYTVIKGIVTSSETLLNLGMKEVFERTCTDIYNQYQTEILVPELQNLLDDGKVYVMDKRAMKRKQYDFSEVLFKNCKSVCEETIEKMKSIHNYFADCNIIVATGGTYEAWQEEFDAVFKDMEGLEIVPGNVNDVNLSNVFSNVRGYYFYRAGKLRDPA